MIAKPSKKTIITLMVTLIVIVLGVLGASYAFFQSSISNSGVTNIIVRSNTIDSLVFTKGDDIKIMLTQDNMAQGQGDITDSTTTTATLSANNASAASYGYKIELVILNNSFTHSSGSTPELVLTVTKNGTTIINNMDITTARGSINIPTASGGIQYNHTISASAGSTTTDTFVATVTFKNLNTDQSINEGREFEGYLQIENNEELCAQGTPLNTCIASLYTTDGENSLFSNGGIRYGGGVWESLNYYVPAEYNNGTDSPSVDLNTSDGPNTMMALLIQDGLMTQDGNIITVTNGNSYDMSESGSQMWMLLFELRNLGYIAPALSGSEPNNYVCFGANSCTANDDHLYRIIGVNVDGTNLVKLMKATPAGSNVLGANGGYSSGNSYYWNNLRSNDWHSSELNTVNLNGFFLNTYLGNTWANKIETVDWDICGVDGYGGSEDSRMVSCGDDDIYSAKVGLIYVTDFNSAWGGSNGNWLATNAYDWTISRDNEHDENVVMIWDGGWLDGMITQIVGANGQFLVRPAFYLKSNVTYVSGRGTRTNPIIIN